MDWKGEDESSNIEDRRGIRTPHIVGGGIGTIVIAVIIYFLGGNPMQVLQSSQSMSSSTQSTVPTNPADDTLRQFAAVVLRETEDVWTKIFTQMGKQYQEPTLVLFSESTQSGCGGASAATGPFYCPADKKVYLDLSFFEELQNRFSVPGNFASAYVIAHEVGHHVQDLLGISDKVSRMQASGSEVAGNKLSVKLELQADFLAGVWAHYINEMKKKNGNAIISNTDIASALTAANAIGDDRLQKQAQGYVTPDSFTHGTSQQRMYWFKKGFETGDISQGNTFNDPSLN
ncbi:MAG: zinc metallopeptidase [Chitinophagaceae bacterium]|jgi:predicted metalloprotease|nr:zinc metallopeptidase [Chitinophagaceae bacterium]